MAANPAQELRDTLTGKPLDLSNGSAAWPTATRAASRLRQGESYARGAAVLLGVGHGAILWWFIVERAWTRKPNGDGSCW